MKGNRADVSCNCRREQVMPLLPLRPVLGKNLLSILPTYWMGRLRTRVDQEEASIAVWLHGSLETSATLYDLAGGEAAVGDTAAARQMKGPRASANALNYSRVIRYVGKCSYCDEACSVNASHAIALLQPAGHGVPQQL